MPDFDALSREELIALVRQLWEMNQQLQARVVLLEAENERLRNDPPSGVGRALPSFVKPNRAPKEKKTRKKRPYSYVRLREAPTQVVEHALAECPGCGRSLGKGWVARTRQVIEIPPTSYEVIEHQIRGHYCGVCNQKHVASPDLSGEVLGRHRVGVRLMSVLSYLRTVGRMPVRRIQEALRAIYGLHLSIGEIVEVLHAVAEAGEGHYARLKETLRQSEFVNADETGWREDGQNGYLWSFSAPEIRYFHRDKSRGHQVPEGVLGEAYGGILVSDFYGGYHYHLGLHQRCWVHFLRDLHTLKEAHPEDAEVGLWVSEVKKVYEDARSFSSQSRRARIKARERFQQRLEALGQPYARTDARQRILAERIMRFVNELFTFVEFPQVPSENNAAERAIRPSVIDRKVTGGSRSKKGSETRSVLTSLFRTWEARGLNPLETCRKMLTYELAPT